MQKIETVEEALLIVEVHKAKKSQIFQAVEFLKMAKEEAWAQVREERDRLLKGEHAAEMLRLRDRAREIEKALDGLEVED